MAFFTIILAAGAGTRMKSDRAKVTHELLGKPLIRWVVDAAKKAGSAQVITVVGHGREQVIPLVKDDTVVVTQEEQRGTGHAVMMARDVLTQGDAPAPDASAHGDTSTPDASAHGDAPTPDTPASDTPSPDVSAHGDTPISLVVLCGDTPLITSATIASLVASQQKSDASICLLTHLLDDPTNYGRVIRDAHDNVVRIVEEKDATAQERAVRECNSGAYCFDLAVLLEALASLNNDNAQHEYYLTDVVGYCVKKGLTVSAHVIDAEEARGINSRVQLAQAVKSMQRRINTAHMDAGVTMLDPMQVWVDFGVKLENDVELLPLTLLLGETWVGSGSVLGPNTRVTNSTIGRGCRVDESVLEGVTLKDGVSCGPRAYLRPGTIMEAGSKAGTHVEIKNSVIGPGSKVPHLSYLGDATLGEDVNIGAGTITCNYDGFDKNATKIGDRTLIGSDTMLVAPVTVGSDVVTGAGSVITEDVPDGALGIERTEQVNKEDWAYRYKEQKSEYKEKKTREYQKEKQHEKSKGETS